jgi:hypothetical protein
MERGTNEIMALFEAGKLILISYFGTVHASGPLNLIFLIWHPETKIKRLLMQHSLVAAFTAISGPGSILAQLLIGHRLSLHQLLLTLSLGSTEIVL